ncbi:retrovirus-related pol polyprotein from transposon TNT 1-94 [Tanacetum coccineum]
MLELYDAKVSHEDANLKFLRSLPSVWHVVATMIRDNWLVELLTNIAFLSTESQSSTYETIVLLTQQLSQKDILRLLKQSIICLPLMTDEGLAANYEDAMEDIVILMAGGYDNCQDKKVLRKNREDPSTFKPKNGILLTCHRLFALIGLWLLKIQTQSLRGQQTTMKDIDLDQEFDDEPFDAEHVHFGQDRLGDFDWSNKADDTPVSLALMATNSEIRDHPIHVYKLKKALYGLKQAPRAWYDELSTFLLQNHVFKGTIDPTLFIRHFDDDILVVHVYVDDIIFGSTHPRGFKDTFKSTSGGAQFLSESWLAGPQRNKTTQLTDYGYHFNKIPIYCDSKSAIAISCNPVQHSRTKHIALRYHFIKEHVEKGMIELYFVKTNYQLADLFTKALPVDRFNYLVCRLGMRSLSPTELERLNRRDLPRNTSLERVEVLGMIEKRSKVRMEIMPTEIELALEQSQQGVSYEVSRSTHFYQLSHSEIVDIENVAVFSSL